MAFEIYTNREQCEDFGVSYMDDPETLVINAATLLRSADYDDEHRRYLKPMGNDTLILKRTKGMWPGWWIVSDRIDSNGRRICQQNPSK